MTEYNLARELQNHYAIDLANAKGVSEGQLANIRLSYDTKLISAVDIKEFIKDLELLGPVKCITRNTGAISIQEGVYSNQFLSGYKEVNISAEAGLILNPRKLDLRIFFKHWKYIYYVEQSKHNIKYISFQVFDDFGDAIHKIYMTEDTVKSNVLLLLDKYECYDQTPPVYSTKEPPPRLNNSVFNQTIDTEWRGMKEVHDFYLLMYKYKMSRQDLFCSVSDDLAYRVSNDSLFNILTQAKELCEELTIFIANKGCVQIYTGYVDRLFYKNGWVNVFNDNNKTHIMSECISDCWIVRKPGEFGFVTSLEVFSDMGDQVVQIYGQRNEGEKERESWRNIINNIS